MYEQLRSKGGSALLKSNVDLEFEKDGANMLKDKEL